MDDKEIVVLDISSDEEKLTEWNDDDDDDDDDHKWLTDVLDEVNKGEEVVVCVSDSEETDKDFKFNKKDDKEEEDDCVVLDCDPNNDEMDVGNDGKDGGCDDGEDDIVVVSEKGKVACRDYPHSRHLCIKFPFATTPNQSHCEQCYCYVCDSLAPCVYWGNGIASTDHCHATDKDALWALARKNAKNGNKGVQPLHKAADAFRVNRMHAVDLSTPAMVRFQPQSEIPRPSSIHAVQSQSQISGRGSIRGIQTSANLLPPIVTNETRNHILASMKKLHPDLVSQMLLRKNGSRVRQNHNLGTQHQRLVFKRTSSAGVATTGIRNTNCSFRGNFGNPRSRLQNYPVNRMVSPPDIYLGSLQSNAINTPAPYTSQSQNYRPSTVNNQPLPPQPQFSNHFNPNVQSQVNSNLFPGNLQYPQPHVVSPSSSRPQLVSSQPSYTVPAQSSYPVPSQTQIDSTLVPASDHTESQGNEVQNVVTDFLKDYGLNLPSSQDSATVEGAAGPMNESSLAKDLRDYQYDWIFENQPVETGMMDINGSYGLTDLSSDSAFIDTGPIFEF